MARPAASPTRVSDAPLGAPARALLRGLGVVVALVVLDRVSDVASYGGLPITPWNPAVGLAVALLVHRPAAAAPAVFLGLAIALLIAGGLSPRTLGLATPLAVAAVMTAGYAAAALLVRGGEFDPSLPRLADIVRLIAVATPAAAVVGAAQTVVFAALGPLPADEIPAAAFRLAVGDLVGIAVVTPLALRIGAGGVAALAERCAARPAETASWLAVVAAAVWIVFGLDDNDGFRFFCLLFLPVTAIALRGGLDGALVGIALTQLGLVGMVQLRGVPASEITELQVLMLALSATGLLIGVVVGERERADVALRENDARLKERERQIARVARLSASAAMVSAIAHDLNQPLTAARAFARAAARRFERDPRDVAGSGRELREMVGQIDVAAAIIVQLREFLRRGEPRRSTVDLAELVAESCALMRPEASRRGVAIEADAAPGLPPAHVDRVQIQQVILNLLRNAVEAIGEGGGPMRVVATARRAGDAPAVEIAVRDSGPGIPAEVASRLFEAFATTKPDGLGLGLAVGRAIVEAHGGRLWLAESGREGAEFRLALPLPEGAR